MKTICPVLTENALKAISPVLTKNVMEFRKTTLQDKIVFVTIVGHLKHGMWGVKRYRDWSPNNQACSSLRVPV